MLHLVFTGTIAIARDLNLEELRVALGDILTFSVIAA